MAGVILAAAVLTACGAPAPTPTAAPATATATGATTDQAPAEPTSTTEADATATSAGTVTTYLDGLRDLGDPLDFSGVAEINGTSHPHSIGAEYCPPSDNREWQFNLARGYQSLHATIGLDDMSNTKGVVRFDVFGDDQSLYSEDVGFGIAKELDVPVKGVLRLRLVSTVLAAPGCAGTKPRWGEARVVGLEGQVPTTS